MLGSIQYGQISQHNVIALHWLQYCDLVIVQIYKLMSTTITTIFTILDPVYNHTAIRHTGSRCSETVNFISDNCIHIIMTTVRVIL